MEKKTLNFCSCSNGYCSSCNNEYFIVQNAEMKINTLPETNIAPENGWLEYDHFLLGPSLFFRCETVSFGKDISSCTSVCLLRMQL